MMVDDDDNDDVVQVSAVNGDNGDDNKTPTTTSTMTATTIMQEAPRTELVTIYLPGRNREEPRQEAGA